MEYLHKVTELPAEDLLWNIPEQKQGLVSIIGGNLQSFRAPVKVAEYLAANYPVKTVNLVLPDVLKTKLPVLDNLVFLKSTDSGSFASEEELDEIFESGDYNLLVGDLSKNAITAKAIQSACLSSGKPILATRDAVDLLAGEQIERILMNENLIIMCSLMQLQKIFRAVYYPKMLTLSQSLVQVAEALHKFTLSYPTNIVTLHDGQILVAKNGNAEAVPLEKTGYSVLEFWNGEVAAKIVALNLYNPGKFLEATVTAIMN